MSALLESKRYCKLDVLYMLKSFYECCTKYTNCKLATFWISVLWESKRFYKLDVLCALKSLHEYCTKYFICKLTAFWNSVLQIGCYVCIEKFAITLYKMPQL